MNILTYIDGWGGGEFFIDGEVFNTKEKPVATLIIGRKKYKAVYKTVHGLDHDHGNSCSWEKIHIGILDGDLRKRFLSVADLNRHKIYIELL